MKRWAICNAPAGGCGSGKRRRLLVDDGAPCRLCGSEMRRAKMQAPPELSPAEWWTLRRLSGDTTAPRSTVAEIALERIGLIERATWRDGKTTGYRLTATGQLVLKTQEGKR